MYAHAFFEPGGSRHLFYYNFWREPKGAYAWQVRVAYSSANNTKNNRYRKFIWILIIIMQMPGELIQAIAMH